MHLCKLNNKETESNISERIELDSEQENKDSEEQEEENLEEEYVKKDPIRKNQYDYNKNFFQLCTTCKYSQR